MIFAYTMIPNPSQGSTRVLRLFVIAWKGPACWNLPKTIFLCLSANHRQLMVEKCLVIWALYWGLAACILLCLKISNEQ